jgi:hypothetical protein
MGKNKSTQVFTLNKACSQGLYPTLQLLTRGKEAFQKCGNMDLITQDYFFFFFFFCQGIITFVKVSQNLK